MDVPCICCLHCSVCWGTGAMARHGAHTEGRKPSAVGPREEKVYDDSLTVRSAPPSGGSIEYWSAIISGLTYAPTVMGVERHPGEPSVVRAGPLLPAEVKTV